MDNQRMQTLDAFFRALDKETECLEQLIALENEKNDALRQVDVEALMKVNANEEEVMQFMEGTERRRKEIVISLARENRMTPDVTLAELVKGLPDDVPADVREKMQKSRTRIRELTDKLQVVLKENREMVQANLSIIDMTLGYAQKKDKSETYNYGTQNSKESRDKLFIINQIA